MGPGFFWFGFFIRVRLCHDIQNSPLTKKGGCRRKAKSARSPKDGFMGQKIGYVPSLHRELHRSGLKRAQTEAKMIMEFDVNANSIGATH